MPTAEGTYAKIVADSVSPEGVRLTTMEVRFHRFVLAEFNTHRVFSRNSASSRAIPVAKQLQRIEDDPAVPVAWPAEQKGMQGGDEVEGLDLENARTTWDDDRKTAIFHAKELSMGCGVHKSLANRLLEPHMWHTAVITSTAWGNFFTQRCSPMAQPEIRVAAEAMQDALYESEPAPTEDGHWHLPYVGDDSDTLDVLAGAVDAPAPWDVAVKVSAARCARVSYLTQDGRRDPQEDLNLFERLVRDGHWSPLEHVATPWAQNRQSDGPWMTTMDGSRQMRVPVTHLPKVGNLLGWRSLRTQVETERDIVTYR